jgi:hypothetical protein
MNSPKRLTVEAVRENVRRANALLTEKKCSRAGCHTSWLKHREYASDTAITGLSWNEGYEKQRDQALAGYDRDIVALEAELKGWEEALSHALDSLEGRV